MAFAGARSSQTRSRKTLSSASRRSIACGTNAVHPDYAISDFVIHPGLRVAVPAITAHFRAENALGAAALAAEVIMRVADLPRTNVVGLPEFAWAASEMIHALVDDHFTYSAVMPKPTAPEQRSPQPYHRGQVLTGRIARPGPATSTCGTNIESGWRVGGRRVSGGHHVRACISQTLMDPSYALAAMRGPGSSARLSTMLV